MCLKITQQSPSIQTIERAGCACDGAAEGLVRPESLVENLLDLMVRLVQVHADLLFDDIALLFDLTGSEFRIEEHVGKNIEEFIETVAGSASVETGCLFA